MTLPSKHRFAQSRSGGGIASSSSYPHAFNHYSLGTTFILTYLVWHHKLAQLLLTGITDHGAAERGVG